MTGHCDSELQIIYALSSSTFNMLPEKILRHQSKAYMDAFRIFSWEKDKTGKRSFIVTSYEEFWRQYQESIPAHRHYYEIIQEGWPCHLYFGTASSLWLLPNTSLTRDLLAIRRTYLLHRPASRCPKGLSYQWYMESLSKHKHLVTQLVKYHLLFHDHICHTKAANFIRRN